MPQSQRRTSLLPPGQQLAAAHKWPLVGERAPASALGPQAVEAAGLVARPQVWTLEELRSMPQTVCTVDVHCVTRWSKPGMVFGGVLLAELVQRAEVLPEARYVSFVADSARGHSTSLLLQEALDLGALVALEAQGAPLPVAHGGPVRMVVPGKYFYKSLKWLARLDFLAEDRLGYWEREAGYHNGADPWQEQRYAAPVARHGEMQARLARRELSGCHLRGLDAVGHELTGLRAAGAVLRNANFARAALAGACFDGANLTNANFEQADLRGTTFRGADLEGTNLAGADLRGCDFSSASLLAASFCREAPDGSQMLPARLDAKTRFDPTVWEQLLPAQAACLARLLDAARSTVGRVEPPPAPQL